jgi:hypothetical protein
MKILYILFFILIVFGTFLIDRYIVVIRETCCLSSADSTNFESIQRTFGNQKLRNKTNSISFYHMPSLGKKICYSFIFEKSGFEVIRKEIVDNGLFWNGRALSDSTEDGVLITTIVQSNQLSALCSQLQDATRKKLESELRVHAISQRIVIFPDEDVWFLDFQRDGNSNWARWYGGSKKWEYLENAFFKLEGLN